MRCLAALLLTASPLPAADNWNQFRGPTGTDTPRPRHDRRGD
ncbi:MAG TPA: hypothetical protein VGJ05_05950 [Fimbriiglobus sp.]